jgi:hypothetical protein
MGNNKKLMDILESKKKEYKIKNSLWTGNLAQVVEYVVASLRL